MSPGPDGSPGRTVDLHLTGAGPEAGGDFLLPVWADFAAGQAGVVVDGGVDEGAAGAGAVLAAGLAAEFPGRDLLRGRMTVAEVLATGAVDRLTPLGANITPDTVLDTRDFVRPVFRDGLLTLDVTPVAAGTFIPFELEHRNICGH